MERRTRRYPDNTIGGLADNGDSLTVSCNRCRHYADLDLHKLAERLGPLHSSMLYDLAPKLRCSACGAKGPRDLKFTLISGAAPKGYMPPPGYKP